jgi:hypothetical protein
MVPQALKLGPRLKGEFKRGIQAVQQARGEPRQVAGATGTVVELD